MHPASPPEIAPASRYVANHHSFFALAVHLVAPPLTRYHEEIVAVGAFALSVEVPPKSSVLAAVGPRESAEVHLVGHPVALKYCSVLELQHADAMTLVVLPLTLVECAVFTQEYALAIGFTVLELALV